MTKCAVVLVDCGTNIAPAPLSEAVVAFEPSAKHLGAVVNVPPNTIVTMPEDAVGEEPVMTVTQPAPSVAPETKLVVGPVPAPASETKVGVPVNDDDPPPPPEVPNGFHVLAG
jgi:hypothetical protein